MTDESPTAGQQLPDKIEARSIVRRLLDAAPPGSYLALTDGTNTNPEANKAQQMYNDSGAVGYYLRAPEQIAAFFDGLELVEPGVVQVPRWRADPPPTGRLAQVPHWGGVGRKTG